VYEPRVKPLLVAIVGPTASGKSALGLELAKQLDGEIVSCDSTAVYRGFDIGTDKVPFERRRGIPHHLIDVADATERYSVARYSREAAKAVREITAAGHLPIVVGGTGLYYRALTRGLFPGPGRDDGLRERLTRIARRHGVTRLHRLVAHVDAASGKRIQPRDEKRLVRALEVFFLTGQPLTQHFAQTQSPLAEYEFVSFGLRLTTSETATRIAQRVSQQFDRGLLNEVRGLLKRGVPEDAHPFDGFVYRQALEHLQGVRDEAATRDLIIRKNERYARRQLIWFRKEPNLQWLNLPGEYPDALASIDRTLKARERTRTSKKVP
jgi:tRNA dimethylallyltransferase